VEKYIILQYGSSLFGSETKDSDLDLIILCYEKEINKYLL
jgi:predicted nucleotidyltransferase